MTPQEVLNAAKDGNPQAIAALMNRHLQPQGIAAKVKLTDGCLHVMTEGVAVPNQGAIVTYITKGVRGLNVFEIKSLVIYGKATGEDLPAWSDRVELSATLVEPALPEPPWASNVPIPATQSAIKTMPTTRKGKITAGILSVIALGVVWVFVDTLGLLRFSTSRQTRSPIAASTSDKLAIPTKEIGWFTTKEGYVATLNESELEQIVGYAASGDRKAFQAALTDGRAVLLKAGVRVHLKKCIGFLCNKVKVRPEGQSQEIYTLREGLEEAK